MILYLEENALIGSVATEICDIPSLVNVRVNCVVTCPCEACAFVVDGVCQGL